MKRIRRLSLRVQLILMLLVAFTALAGLLTWHLLRDFDARIEAAKTALLNNARLIAARQGALVERADATLTGLMVSPELQLDASTEACNRFLARRLALEPVFSQIATTRSDGDPACSAVPTPGMTNLADRAYFQLVSRSNQTIVADVVTDRSRGNKIVVFGRAGHDPEGRVTGVFLVMLPLSWLERELARMHLPASAILAVLDGSGTVTARFPDPQALTGKTVMESAIVRGILATDGDGTLEATNLAGERRLVAFVPLLTTAAGSQYRLALAISRDEIAAPAQRDALLSLGALFVVLGGTLAAVLSGSHRLLLRPLVILSGTAERLRAGEPGARSGLPHDDNEVGRLARSLDESAAMVEDREHRLAQANRDALTQLAERSEMLDVLAHEVRQPLNNASAALQAATEVLAGSSTGRSLVPLLRAEAVLSEVHASIDNTLAMAALLVGENRIRREYADIDMLVSLAIADMPANEAPRVRVERETSTRTASMDLNLMRMALRNLILNALRYSPGDAPVIVRVSDSDEPLALIIDVIDAGRGVDPELLSHLFDRGRRRTRGASGRRLGLGLHIASRIMALHGGAIVLHRNGTQGTTLRLVIEQNSDG